MENQLGISWHDSAWIPVLNPANIMDYFSERTNPFYDRTCNNEIIKMQRLSTEQLVNMNGIEYTLLHVQEPILFVIRKQHRHSPTQVTPLADYYILAGVVYQAPDLNSVVNSRLLTTIHHLENAFDETISYSRYHPSKGYWWEFKDQDSSDKPKATDKVREEPGSVFQRKMVDILLGELTRKFPPKIPSPPQLEKQPPASEEPAAVAAVTTTTTTTTAAAVAKVTEIKPEQIKQEPNTTETTQPKTASGMKPPPEKKARLG